jgi:hypothetical protein
MLRLLALVACVVVAGCGSDSEGEPLPAEQAAALERQLDSIQSRFEAGDGACRDITDGDDTNTAAVEDILASLPEDVDPDARDAVRQSFDRLFELTSEQCVEQPQQPTDTAPPETTAPETEPTDTIPTETEPTETEPTDTTDTTPTEIPETDTSPQEGGEDGGGGVGVPGGEG